MKKVVNFRPILFLAISMIFGVLSSYFFIKKNLFLAVTFIVLPTIFLILTIILSKENRKKYLIFSVIFATVFAIGGVNFYARIKAFNSTVVANEKYIFTGKVVEVKEYDWSERLILDNVTFYGSSEGKLDGKISLSVYGLTDFDIGDVVKFNASLSHNSIYYEGSLNSSTVAEDVKYKCSVDLDAVEKVGNDKTIFEKVHVFLRDSLKSGLSKQSFSIAYAMTLGNTDYMQEDLLTNFRALGVAHIFAVSGLHIGFFATFLALVFSKIKINRYLKLVITSLILFFYAGVCGFSASSVRSAIMTTVLLSSESMGKKYDKLSSISFACLVILTYSPIELFRVGFQLSFIVVLGLITSTRILKKPFNFLGEKISSLLAGVLSAQLFGIPVCLITFGGVSLISVVANMIVLPVIGVFYMVNFIATIIGGVFGISHITLFLPNLVLEGVAFLVNVFDYTVFVVGGVSVGAFYLFYYASFVFASGYFNFKRVTNVVLATVLMITCLTGCTLLTVKDNNTVKGYVIGDNAYEAYLLRVEKESVLVVSNATSRFGNNRIDRALSKLSIENVDYVIFLHNDTETDVVKIISKLRCDYIPKTIYYYGTEENLDTAGYLERLYEGTNCIAVKGNEFVINEKFSFCYLQRGYGVSLTYKDFTTNVFTSLSYDFDFVKTESGKCDLLIVDNYHEVLSSFYQTGKIVTFFPTLSFADGYSDGNLEIKYN